jgi:hypothetical protein
MTPAERLARSRLAIVEHLAGRDKRHDRSERHERQAARDEGQAPDDGPELEAEDDRRARRGGWFGGMRGAARAWWRHHPAQFALEMATPVLQSEMRKRPFLVLGAAAGIGALLVVTRPWRVISVGTLLVAIVKSSQLSGVVMSAVAGAQGWHEDNRQGPGPFP